MSGEPELTRAATLSVACVLLAGAGVAAFAACALWQAGAILHAVTEAGDAAARAPARTAAARAPAVPAPSAVSAPPAVSAPSAPFAASATAAVSSPRAAAGGDALVALEPALTDTPGAVEPGAPARFEANAEASEQAIPVGLEATLDASEAPLTLGEPPPLDYPRTRCEDIFVYIVTVAEGAPLRSAASLGIGKKGPARLRTPGERLGDWRVLAITDDWTGLNPEVWLERDGAVCRAELAGNPDRVHAPLKPRPPVARGRKKKKKR